MYLQSIDREQDEKLWEMWLARFPNMSKKDFISFDDFKRRAKRKKPALVLTGKKSTAELIKQAEKIKAADKAERGVG